MLMILPDYGICFPVAYALTLSDNLWPLINAFAVRDLAAFVVFTVSFAASLLQAQVSVEQASKLLVQVDVVIDALVRGRRLSLGFEVAADLLRGEVFQ